MRGGKGGGMGGVEGGRGGSREGMVGAVGVVCGGERWEERWGRGEASREGGRRQQA